MDSVGVYVVEVVAGLVEAVEVEVGSDYLVEVVGVEVRLLLLLLSLLVAVRGNWFDLAVAGDPQVDVRVLQFVVQDDPCVGHSFSHHDHLFP